MSSILISRHGPVALPKPAFPTQEEFKTYLDDYERSGIAANASPPKELIQHICNAVTIFSSPSLRAIESLRLLDSRRAPIVDPVFCEEPQIVPNLGGRWPLLLWFSLTRGLGAFHPAELGSRNAMRRRAEEAANLLIAATDRGPVALIAHGWFNRAIAVALSQNGWRRAATSKGHQTFGRVSSTWGYVVFEL